jgi:hypothetical protein
MRPCRPLKINGYFLACFMPISYFGYLWPWRWRRHVPPKCRLTFNWLRGVISQKAYLAQTKCSASFSVKKGSFTCRSVLCHLVSHTTLPKFFLHTHRSREKSAQRNDGYSFNSSEVIGMGPSFMENISNNSKADGGAGRLLRPRNIPGTHLC